MSVLIPEFHGFLLDDEIIFVVDQRLFPVHGAVARELRSCFVRGLEILLLVCLLTLHHLAVSGSKLLVCLQILVFFRHVRGSVKY